MDPRLKRTKFAAHSATLAEQFEAAVIDRTVGSHRLEMTVPEGSTGGGVQALQHIRLVPEEADGGRTYVVGNADRAKKVAELRSLEYIDQVSLDRFGETTGFNAAQYAACMTSAAKFLTTWGMTVMHVKSAPIAAAPPRAPRGVSRTTLMIIIIWSVTVLGIGLTVGILANRDHVHVPN